VNVEFCAFWLHRQVAVIVGPITAMRMARAATSTIPIVFVSGGDPITIGLVTNLSRPGGNITGVSFASAALQPKRLGLLHHSMRAQIPGRRDDAW
jgi:putative ABC transport system substrate-binding protein